MATATAKGTVGSITITGDGTPLSRQLAFVVTSAKKKSTALRLGIDHEAPELFSSMTTLLTAAFFARADVTVEYKTVAGAKVPTSLDLR